MARRGHPEAAVPAPTTRAGLAAYFRFPASIEAVWLAAPPFVLVVASLLTPIRPFDYFWALVQGRAIIQRAAIPAENLFLHTLPADTPFFDQPWLGQLTMYAGYRIGGHAAGLVVFAACLALTMGILLDTALRDGASPRWAAIVGLLVTPLLAYGSSVRTQMFAYPCFAVVMRGATLRPTNAGLRWWLPGMVATVLWSNVHGSFVLAPLVVALSAVGGTFGPSPGETGYSRLRHGLRDSGLLVLATFVNPRGPAIYGYLVGLPGAVRADVDEWLAINPRTMVGMGFLLVAVTGLILALVKRHRLSLASFVPHLVFAVLCLQSQRFVCWWALSAVIALGRLIEPAEMAERRPGPSWANTGLLGVFTLMTAACFPGAPLFERATMRARLPYPEARALSREIPWRTVSQLAHGYTGRLFHTQAVGGLVEWTLAEERPRPVAFVDQRFELVPAWLWRDYFAICDAQPGWRVLLDRYAVGTVLIDETNASGLLTAIAGAPDWREIGAEFGYHLFERQRPSAPGAP